MRVLLIGSTGLLGKTVRDTLTDRRHTVIGASRRGELQVNIRDPESISDMFKEVGAVDSIAIAAGYAAQGSLSELSYQDIQDSVSDKMIGQIEVVRQGINYLTEGGSFTLVSGVTSSQPIARGSILSAINASIDGFVVGAAVDLPKSQRINSVSANVFVEALEAYDSVFPGFNAVTTQEVARAFVRSIEGVETGACIRVGY